MNSQQNKNIQPQSPISAREQAIKNGLMGVRRQVESLLADKGKSDKFLAAALVVAQNKQFSFCKVESIVQALVSVAMLDLNIDPNIGHVYLIKYGDGVQVQTGYKGYIQLLFRSGWLVKALPVYKCDHFRISFDGWDNRVELEPNFDERQDDDGEWCMDNLRGVYVVARHTDTKDEYSDFISRNVIEKLRLKSQNQTTVNDKTSKTDKERIANKLPIGIWLDWYVEMALAKAIKKLAKKLPIGDRRLQVALAADDLQDAGKAVNLKESLEKESIIMDIPQGEAVHEPIDPLNDALATGGKKETTDWGQMIKDASSIDELSSIFQSIPPDDFARYERAYDKRAKELHEPTNPEEKP